jgi:molybdopterin-guanine dinucleotide biosynthesis protein A
MAPPLDDILPVVLVGGRSLRFGRDKLREPMPGGGILVDRPIAALRAVFGPCVHLCGSCGPEIARLADACIQDEHAGAGPLGGIVSSLREAGATGRHAVFILAGDLPGITAEVVRALVDAAGAKSPAKAVLGRTDRLQPCIGLYRTAALPVLERSATAAGKGPALAAVVEVLHPQTVLIPPDAAVNLNTPRDLDAFREQASPHS